MKIGKDWITGNSIQTVVKTLLADNVLPTNSAFIRAFGTSGFGTICVIGYIYDSRNYGQILIMSIDHIYRAYISSGNIIIYSMDGTIVS